MSRPRLLREFTRYLRGLEESNKPHRIDLIKSSLAALPRMVNPKLNPDW